MRFVLISLIAGLGCAQMSAAPLSDSDREALLERLDALRKEAVEKLDAKYRAGFVAYTGALGSPDAALELYLKCVEKVDFIDQKKKDSEFREWKRKEAERLSKPGFKLALRHQLNWLSLTCQAASENSDREKLVAAAYAAMEVVFRDANDLKDQQAVLRQSVVGTVFARAYEINSIKVDDWAMSPLDVQGIFDQMILPPLRNPGSIDKLRDAWVRRAQLEGAVIENWGGAPTRRTDGRIGMAETRPPDMDRFVTDRLPVLQWMMEVDLFKAGDQAGAALRMLAHIEKNISHESAKGWSEEFRTLLISSGSTTAAQPN